MAAMQVLESSDNVPILLGIAPSLSTCTQGQSSAAGLPGPASLLALYHHLTVTSLLLLSPGNRTLMLKNIFGDGKDQGKKVFSLVFTMLEAPKTFIGSTETCLLAYFGIVLVSVLLL